MRAVVQRVTAARVAVGSDVIAGIGPGLCVLVGVTHSDTTGSAQAMASKLWRLRIFNDLDGIMNLSVAEVGGEILVVSQFTLYGDTRRGRRPSWAAAAPGAKASPLVQEVVAELSRLGASVVTGRFGERMQVELTNDGPVTVIVDV
jgi:D-tyrosyl-tRNA(Tyr) deacylase